MNDRELLRYAAIACGELIGEWVSNEDYFDGVLTRWNPLTDYGDAFRLSVKLSLEIDLHRTGVAVRTQEGHKILIYADEIKDGYSAARRAIVRAAAEIGKSML